ncbi:Ig-like domain-containing protein [Paludisphaera rhizosphaerae]|uniref:Ig-like domain-containing protein n=1 Tax=Paludisphaera rhizosphaerae TaxID=2711216 RepID=UPI0013EC6DAE|nr:Ig-like domain-containing protein [Paludisphaera rhizosphaerae]
MFAFLRNDREIGRRRSSSLRPGSPEALETRLALSTASALLAQVSPTLAPAETSSWTAEDPATMRSAETSSSSSSSSSASATDSATTLKAEAASATAALRAAISSVTTQASTTASEIAAAIPAVATATASATASATSQPAKQVVAASAVEMQSATTTDSKSVTIHYKATEPAAGLTFGVYRSADPTFDASDQLVTTYTAPDSAKTVGEHDLTIPVDDGLTIDPARPYVLVVSNPEYTAGATTDPTRTAEFRKFTIGVVSHGGIINQSWTYGAPWQLQIGKLMEQGGYDAVIPFNWIDESNQPGHAAPQGFKLANQIEKILDQLPADTVVDLHMVGHSQGTVVNMVALQQLEKDAPAQLKGGWIKDTMLDPHAANNYVPGQMSTASNPVGVLARMIVNNYQARAKDPTVTVPADVDEAEVFYQHTKIQDVTKITASGYNLWGQVPIPNQSDSPIHYYNLTATNATHSGVTGVALWYRNFIATTLADQTPLVYDLATEGNLTNGTPSTYTPTTASGQRQLENFGPDMVVQGDSPTFSGTAAPNAKVRVYIGPTSDLTRINVYDVVTADATGHWSVSTDQALANGRYRAVAMAYSPDHHTRPAYAIVSMTPMGRFWIGGDPRT